MLLQVKPISQMLSVRDISQLVGGDFGFGNLRVNVAVRVAVHDSQIANKSSVFLVYEVYHHLNHHVFFLWLAFCDHQS